MELMEFQKTPKKRFKKGLQETLQKKGIISWRIGIFGMRLKLPGAVA